MVGAHEISELAARLEVASKTVGNEDLSEDTKKLLSEYRSLHEKIDASLSAGRRDPAAAKRIEDAYATLKDYADLEDYDLVELVVDAMIGYDMPKEDEYRFKTMKEALMQFDFAKIRRILAEVG